MFVVFYSFCFCENKKTRKKKCSAEKRKKLNENCVKRKRRHNFFFLCHSTENVFYCVIIFYDFPYSIVYSSYCHNNKNNCKNCSCLLFFYMNDKIVEEFSFYGICTHTHSMIVMFPNNIQRYLENENFYLPNKKFSFFFCSFFII